MTSEQFSDSKFKPVAMPMPFGAGNANNYTIPGQAQSAANVNFPDGFPIAYSSPHSGGGKYVTRKEMNGIGNLASRYEFFRRAGGIVTFDPAFAAAVGGYPKGAILDYVDVMNVHKVYSAVDNNRVNFIENGVDGVNWVYMNQDKPSIGSVLISVESVPPEGTNIPLGVFKPTRDGVIRFESNITKSVLSTYEETLPGAQSTSSYVYYQLQSGCSVVMCPLGSGNTPSAWPSIPVTNNQNTQSIDWSDYRLLTGDYMATLVRQPYNQLWVYKGFAPPSSTMNVSAGTWYGLVLFHNDDLIITSTTILGANSAMYNSRTKTSVSGGITVYQV